MRRWCDETGKECDFCTNVATFNVARRRERSPVKLAAEILLQWKGWLPRQRMIEVRHWNIFQYGFDGYSPLFGSSFAFLWISLVRFVRSFHLAYSIWRAEIAWAWVGFFLVYLLSDSFVLLWIFLGNTSKRHWNSLSPCALSWRRRIATLNLSQTFSAMSSQLCLCLIICSLSGNSSWILKRCYYYWH